MKKVLIHITEEAIYSNNLLKNLSETYNKLGADNGLPDNNVIPVHITVQGFISSGMINRMNRSIRRNNDFIGEAIIIENFNIKNILDSLNNVEVVGITVTKKMKNISELQLLIYNIDIPLYELGSSDWTTILYCISEGDQTQFNNIVPKETLIHWENLIKNINKTNIYTITESFSARLDLEIINSTIFSLQETHKISKNPMLLDKMKSLVVEQAVLINKLKDII